MNGAISVSFFGVVSTGFSMGEKEIKAVGILPTALGTTPRVVSVFLVLFFGAVALITSVCFREIPHT